MPCSNLCIIIANENPVLYRIVRVKLWVINMDRWSRDPRTSSYYRCAAHYAFVPQKGDIAYVGIRQTKRACQFDIDGLNPLLAAVWRRPIISGNPHCSTLPFFPGKRLGFWPDNFIGMQDTSSNAITFTTYLIYWWVFASRKSIDQFSF